MDEDPTNGEWLSYYTIGGLTEVNGGTSIIVNYGRGIVPMVGDDVEAFS